MKQKKYFMLAAAAALFAACSSDDALTEQTPQQQDAAGVAVGFDVYAQRGITRTGAVGDITTTKLKDNTSDQGKAGFGVFGYYTDNNEYDQQSIPNFMYNQQVKWDGSANFTYAPVKYWPNEYGTNAISDDNDKVSFFAYAPYVEVVPSSGKITASAEEAKWGITGLTRNSATGDPLVKYMVSFAEDEMVDLCWGVCDNPAWSVIQGNIQNINDGVTGLPWLDVQRPLGVTATDRMKFTFKHALSQFNVQIDYDADDVNHNTSTVASGDIDVTRVYVRSITFTGFATKGALNLNNSEAGPDKAYWLDYNGNTDLESGEEVIVYDGRKDGKEGASGAVANNEKVRGLNPNLVQDEEWAAANTHKGVTNTPQNLFNFASATDPVYVIPTGEDVAVTIVYDVETVDKNLATYVSDGKTPGSSIENTISKTINFGGAKSFENGKKYTLKLHLGLNSVKFDADVTDWEDAGSSDTWLPSNAPKYIASTSASAQTVTVAADATTYAFTIAGMDGGEVITATAAANTVVNGSSGTSNVTAVSGTSAGANGEVSASMTITENTTFFNAVSAANSWVGTSVKQVIIDLIQLPHALGLGVSGTSGSVDLTLTKTAIGSEWSAVTDDAAHIRVWKNGVELTKATGTPADGQFKFDTSGKITLGTAAATGETYKVYIQAGDADAETESCTI